MLVSESERGGESTLCCQVRHRVYTWRQERDIGSEGERGTEGKGESLCSHERAAQIQRERGDREEEGDGLRKIWRPSRDR